MEAVLIQQDIVWGNPAENCRRLSRLLDEAPQADLYVLPEMFSTGFATQSREIAENAPAPSLDWMRETAKRKDAAIAGSIALHEGQGRCYNRQYFVKPDGSVLAYDKRHLFTYGGEDRFFTAGSERVIAEWRGWRFLLLTCYDLRFPVWCRCRDDYDAIICIANWPDKRQNAFDTLIRARAIENQSYMLGVNRVGTDAADLHYAGGTALVHPYGHTLAACENDREGWCAARLDADELREYRKKFPVLSDADPFTL